MLRVLLMAVIVAFSMPALAAYKCQAGGKTTYSDAPCPGGKVIDVSDPASASEATKIRQQTAQENKKVKQLESARHKREAIDEREQQRVAHSYAARKHKCASLAQRQGWAHEDAAKAVGKAAAKAKLRARRADEKFQLACSA